MTTSACEQACSPINVSLGHISNSEALRSEKAYEMLMPLTSGYPNANIKFKAFDHIPAHDARSHGKENFSLERHGFEFINYPHTDGLTIDGIRSDGSHNLVLSFLAHLEIELGRHLGADKVILYDWRV